MASKICLVALARLRTSAMSRLYRMELNSVARPEFRHRNRGHILNNADRGITLAKHHRRSKLIIYIVADVHLLDRLVLSLRYVCNGIIVLDSDLRISTVND